MFRTNRFAPWNSRSTSIEPVNTTRRLLISIPPIDGQGGGLVIEHLSVLLRYTRLCDHDTVVRPK